MIWFIWAVGLFLVTTEAIFLPRMITVASTNIGVKTAVVQIVGVTPVVRLQMDSTIYADLVRKILVSTATRILTLVFHRYHLLPIRLLSMYVQSYLPILHIIREPSSPALKPNPGSQDNH
jgi:hypothetical protein